MFCLMTLVGYKKGARCNSVIERSIIVRVKFFNFVQIVKNNLTIDILVHACQLN